LEASSIGHGKGTGVYKLDVMCSVIKGIRRPYNLPQRIVRATTI